MKNKIIMISLLPFYSFAYASDLTTHDLGVSQFIEGLCASSVEFHDKPILKQQNLKINESISLKMSQGVSQYVVKGKTIASNVLCQKLNGQNYTGSEQEWANYIAHALEGLKKADAKNIQLVLSAGEDKIFHGVFPHKEYVIKANLGGNEQIIYNLAILDKLNNTVYSISVSGSKKIKAAVEIEFTRLVDSFKLDETRVKAL